MKSWWTSREVLALWREPFSVCSVVLPLLEGTTMIEQCPRPNCSNALSNKPVTHYIVMGSQRVPVCTVCANEAFKEDFALIGVPSADYAAGYEEGYASAMGGADTGPR